VTVANGVVAAVGHTPLIKLKRASEETGCTILGKAEFMNPGQSVKDRAGLQMILEAEKRGELRPGGLVVEATAGNTGIGLALVANALGYKTIIVMPDNQSVEKMDTLRALRAELVTVPPTKFSNPGHFVHTSRRLAEETAGAVWANQFDNIANRMAHIRTTAPEIWAQTGGRIDGFTCAVGTGGTLAGVGLGLKERDEDIVIALSDPYFWRAGYHTVAFMAIDITLPLVGALLLAILVSEVTRGRTFFRIALFTPYVLSAAVVSVMWKMIYSPKLCVYAWWRDYSSPGTLWDYAQTSCV